MHCAAVVTYSDEQTMALIQRRKAAKEIARSTYGIPSTEYNSTVKTQPGGTF